MEFNQIDLDIKGASTMVWFGGNLCNLSAVKVLYSRDNNLNSDSLHSYGGDFDYACVSPKQDVIALIDTLGTKALLLTPNFKLIRQINRSFSHANTFRYPFTFFTLPSGETAIAHCPNASNVIEIEEAFSGERITKDAKVLQDVFHSRLAVSDSSRYILSAGWIWQPYDSLFVFDREKLQASNVSSVGRTEPEYELKITGFINAEVSGACFVDDDVVVSTSMEDPWTDEEDRDEDWFGHGILARWSLRDKKFIWQRKVEECAGDLVPFCGNILALNQWPKLFDSTNGDLLHEWPELKTGPSTTSLIMQNPVNGPARIAIDEKSKSFAVSTMESVSIVEMV